MYFTIYFIFFIFFTLDCSIGERRILNGRKTSIKYHAYQAAIFKRVNNIWKQHCGGSIINKYTILSAAHCFYYDLSTKNYFISVGSTNVFKGQKFTIAHIIIHGKYDPTSMRYDVSIVKLQRPLKFNCKVKPIPLQAANEEVQPSITAIASGWGTTNFELGIKPFILYEVEVYVIEERKCNSIYVYDITEVMICAELYGSTLCYGDSGGPLVAEGKLIGIATFVGSNCSVTLPQVYAKVSALRDFIDKYV